MPGKSTLFSDAGENLGNKPFNSVYEKLLRERIIFLGSEVNDEVANTLAAQILLLTAEDPNKDISFYINSPGGSVTAGLAIFDTMQLSSCDIATYSLGLSASMGQFLLSAGTPGKRYALQHTRILMHQPSGGIGGTASDIVIQAKQFVAWKDEMSRLNAQFTGQPIEKIIADSDRDHWFSATEAKEYGFVDHVISRVKT